MIRIDNASVRLGGKPVLQEVGFAAGAGEFVALTGPNGAGKSTLLKLACGLIAPEAGAVELGGKSVAAIPYAARAALVSWLPQVRPAAWNLSAEDVVALGLGPGTRSAFAALGAAERTRVQAALDRMEAAHLAGRGIQTLSGGEAARVHMARVLVSPAPVLLLDEPVAALDIEHQLSLMDVLAEEARAGRTVVAAIHDLSLAARFCSRVAVLQGGRKVADGAPNEALSDAILESVFRVRRASEGTFVRIA
ncbi:MAG: ABC transporter ATP-binding protein [Hyphomonas sp.]|nr:ABC transporter ATP-binding protein [Hyphomonas sp.]